MRLTVFALLHLFALSTMAAPSCSSLFSDISLEPKMAKQVQTYLDDTVHSLEEMRGANGLLQDTMYIRTENGHYEFHAVTPSTSPTNIAIDLLVQTELILQGQQVALAKKNISRILATLGKVERHSSGLFFGWYSTDEKSSVTGANVSSIDNMHLALALWTIKESFPKTMIGKKAEALLAPMDFSLFYDESSGLIGGNFAFNEGKWTREAYNFSNLGSEARTLYSAGWALGFFKKYSNKPDFLAKAFQNLEAEVAKTQQGRILKLWDGSAFQLFFPKIFVAEEKYSTTLKQMYLTSGEYMLAEGERRKLQAPAAHSPGVARIEQNQDHGFYSVYNDKAGNKNLVSSGNKDVLDPTTKNQWDEMFTPYALFMAATTNPTRYLPIFENLQKVSSVEGSLYSAGIGWMDGLNVLGKRRGHVVPAQIAVNQGMIGLALLEMQSTDGLSASARAIYHNPQARSRMHSFYQLFDQKIDAASVNDDL